MKIHKTYKVGRERERERERERLFDLINIELNVYVIN